LTDCRRLLALVAVAAAGCRSYKAEPLDLDAHRADVRARLADPEPVAAFAARLRAAGASAPERFDPADGLTPAEGEVLALFFNADLRLARARAGIAQADAETAGLWADPVFGFDAAEVLSGGANSEFGLTLGFTLPVSGRLAADRDRARAAHEAARRRVAAAEWRTRAEVRRAWAAWTAAVERRRVLEDASERVGRLVELAGTLGDSGELRRAETRLFAVALAERRAAVTGAALGERRARTALLGLLGLAPDDAVELVPALAAPEPVEPEPGDPGARLVARNPTLAARRAEYRVAEEKLRLEIRKQYPDISLGAGYGNEDDDRLLLGISVPIPVLNANRKGIAGAAAERKLARVAAQTTFERLARELAGAQATRAAARERRRRFEDEVVPLLAEQAAELDRLMELGEVDALLLLETATRQVAAKLRLLDLRLEEARAASRVRELLGPDAPDATKNTGESS